MAKFLIEIPHDPTKQACDQAIKIFSNSGSHFLTHADWGCLDGEHKAWFVIEIDGKDQAQNIIPSAYRHQAKIIQLTRFALDDMDKILPVHDK